MGLRYDISTLQPVKRMPDGRICADAHLTRTGIFEYLNPDGTVRRELRLPEEVFRPDSMSSFALAPVTDDHPPVMLCSDNACEYAVGAVGSTITRDDDHIRATLGVYDADTIAKMDAGKLEVSCGYNCDVEDKPGTHPIYGAYDAIQRNIVGNHVAIVEHGRAGSATVRMDAAATLPVGAAVMIPSGGTVGPASSSPVQLAPVTQRAMLVNMANANPAARIDVVVHHDAGPSAAQVVDPQDLANRNAASATSDEDPDEGDDEDAYDMMYDDDGNLTEGARAKIAASNFAVPGKEQLPLHDPKAVRSSMKKFGDHSFEDADEAHGAFNRITSKAKQFGISTSGFAKAHAGKLDKKDTMPTIDPKTAAADKAAKKAERKAKLDAAMKAKTDAEDKVAGLEGQVKSLQKDLETARADAAKARTDADSGIEQRVANRVDLVNKATAAGVKVEPKMVDRAIKIAVVKHVDNEDIPADAHDAFVEAYFLGALKRAKTDAAETAAGANALAAARGAVNPSIDARADAGAADRNDDTDENAAARRLRVSTATTWQQPGRSKKETK